MEFSSGEPPTYTSRSVSEGQFTCPCCYQLMLEPTTLSCGHTFCRYCLAKWTETSGKKTCPECRQVWTGLPQVNFTLRDTITRLFPERYEDRNRERADDYNEKLKAFDALYSQQGLDNGTLPGQAFICGIVCALILVLVPWLYSWMTSPDHSSLVHKPVTRWTDKDVFQWVTGLGPWAEVYANSFLDQKIDGYLLLALSDYELESTYNMTDLHIRAFLMSVDNIKALGVKPPETFWEYKELYPRDFFFFMSTVQVLPRSLFVYTYIYHYDDTFLPFIHAVCPEGEQDLSRPHMLNSPSKKQWVSFLPAAVYLPFLVIAKFAWLWVSIHYITVAMVTVVCVAETFQEANSVVLLYRSVTRGQASLAIIDAFKSYARSIFGQCVFYVIWQFTPWILCEVYFYFCVYILPFQTLYGWIEKLYHKLRYQ